MKKLSILKAIFFIVYVATILVSCSKKGGSNPAPADTGPQITGLSVNSGPYTTRVTITGSGFSTSFFDNKVFFNGVPAVVTGASSTKIYTTVPLAAGTGDVTVTINGSTATGPSFTYQQAEVVTSFAGSGSPGAKDGMGTAATFFQPNGIAVDAASNVYVADQDNNLVRKITPAGLVSTLAGSGVAGSSDGTGSAVSFSHPQGITVDGAGNVYVSDRGGSLIRKIDPSGAVSTLATGFGNAIGLAADAAGNIYVADQGAGQIKEITSAGVVTTFYNGSAVNIFPDGIAIDKSGNIFATDQQANAIFKISPLGKATTFAGGNFLPNNFDGTGAAASFNEPYGITIDANGNLFVTDGDKTVRKITPGAVVTTFTGNSPSFNNGPIMTAGFAVVYGITVDSSGNLYVVDNSIIRKISFQ